MRRIHDLAERRTGQRVTQPDLMRRPRRDRASGAFSGRDFVCGRCDRAKDVACYVIT